MSWRYSKILRFGWEDSSESQDDPDFFVDFAFPKNADGRARGRLAMRFALSLVGKPLLVHERPDEDGQSVSRVVLGLTPISFVRFLPKPINREFGLLLAHLVYHEHSPKEGR